MRYTERLARFVYWSAILFCLLSVWDGLFGLWAYDSTDSGRSRSGLRLFTDAATGCQYLSVFGGGITPRLNGLGKHIGCVDRGPLPPA